MKKLLGAIIALVVFANVLSSGYVSAEELPRDETLYVGGGLWSQPNNFNPLTPWAAVTGTIGLLYETMFLYDPLNDKLEPWLAESGQWVSDNTYEVKLKEGLKWQDGKPLTAEDVKFTFDIAKENGGVGWAPIWDWLSEVKVVDDRTVQFIFSQPHYEEWTYWLYNIPIVPKHVWESIEDPISYANTDNPVGSGMYKLYKTDEMRAIWIRNDDWWGTKVFGKPAPKYIVYVIVYSNNVALSMLVKGDLDWSNFFIPGVPDVKSTYNIVTWYDDKPYHLPANTAFLFLNTQKEPLNNPDFRRALAYAINPDEIAARAFQNQVLPAKPSGLLPVPVFEKIKAKDLEEKYGWKYDPEKAIQILDSLGFKDVNGDGYREFPDGSPMKFEIIVPYGWTDWMEMIRIISEQLASVGIRAEPKFPDYSKYWEDLTKGTFDMAINNFGSQVYATPWQWFNWVLYPDVTPVGEPSYSGNWGRYKNDRVIELLELINTEKDENKKLQYYRELQEIMLKEVPAIPIVYNGAWFEASPAHWTNWPTEKNPYAYPISWNNYWQMGGLKVLLGIKPVKSTTSPAETGTATTSQPAETSQTTTSSGEGGGICGPAALVGLAVVPLLLRKRKR
ncbi:MAG: peptide/nickel transport system substrate-binding protein [Thermococcaceae archaeon]|nr:peptide/nickel transport system substrate-binding protein [Thermococcaceae archaeon]MDK2915225.1 peptide/nickel transport system substrate-binding protein [Thermococcaceae archaeon]